MPLLPKQALYFNANPIVEDILCNAVLQGLGVPQFARFTAKGEKQYEIETFVSQPSHITQTHFDFQHNFTIQLAGKKRWRIKASKETIYPLVGATPHFVNNSNADHQLKLNKLTNNHFERRDAPKEGYTEVVMEEGSIMYFPPGLWHSVEAIGDSLSISCNISFTMESIGDILTDAIKQLLLKKVEARQPIIHVYNKKDMADLMTPLLNTLPEVIRSLQPSEILPPNLVTAPSYGEESDDEEDFMEDINEEEEVEEE
mmetsp:Transcript_11405/g.16893  ORF Transcript_11405/g.16893 Transcript_11405/m.16893 type:complete len:257 (+) Transcript_11405:420-1190(+)